MVLQEWKTRKRLDILDAGDGAACHETLLTPEPSVKTVPIYTRQACKKY